MTSDQLGGSVVLASCFNPEDYLIPAALSPGSEQAEQLCAEAQAFCEGGSPGKAPLLVPRCWPCASLEAAVADRLSPTSAGSSGERRSPTRQRLQAPAAAGPLLSGSSTSSTSTSSDSRCRSDGAVGDEICNESSAEGSRHWASASDRGGGCFGHSAESGADGCSSASGSRLAGSLLASTPPLRLLSHSPEPSNECPLAGEFAAEAGGLVTPAGCLLTGGNATGRSSAAGSCGPTPSSCSTAGGLQQRLELAEARLLAEAEARRALQRRMAEQRAEAERQHQALGQQYEQRLVALRRELQAAAAAGSLNAEGLSRSFLAGSQQGTLSAQEQEVLRRQLADQEVLLRAYQAENELAVERLRQHQAQAARRAEEGAAQLEELQQALALAQAERDRQPPATPVVDAARLQELLRLQAQLQGVQAAAAQREGQLQQQVGQLEQQLQEAHCRAEALQAECTQLRDTQQQLADSDRLVRQQADVIRQLERQLRLQETSSSGADNVASTQHLLLLHAENASLRQALQHQHHQEQQQTGFTSSTGGPDDGSGAEELRGKLSKLQAALHLKEEQHQRQVKALRQEHERLRVEEGIRAASRAGAGRVKELEAQLEAQQKRVRMLESKLLLASKGRGAAAAPATSGEGSSARGSSAAPQAGASAGFKSAALTRGTSVGKAAAAQREALMTATAQLQQKEQRVRRLEAELARRDAELVALQKRAAHADEQLNAAAEQQQASGQELAALKQAVAEVTAANDALQAQVREVPLLRQQLAEQQAAAAELRQQAELLHGATAAVASLQAQQAEAHRQAAAQEEQHAAELRRMERGHALMLEQARQACSQAAAADWQPRMQAAEQRAAEFRGRAEQLERDLRSARAGLPWTPSAADFAELERRMAECEARAQAREAHWRGVAEAQQRAAQAHQERLRERLEGGLQAQKRQAVDGFQRQLDTLLVAARLLPAQAGPGAPGPGKAP